MRDYFKCKHFDWQSLQSTNQEPAHFFFNSTFEIALLCAHLVNQNLMPPYHKTVVSSKVQFSGLFIGACDAAHSGKLNHCVADFGNLCSHFLLLQNSYWLLWVTCGNTWKPCRKMRRPYHERTSSTKQLFWRSLQKFLFSSFL